MQKNGSLRSKYSFIAPLRKKSVAVISLSVILVICLFAALFFYMRSPDMDISSDYTKGSITAGVAGILCLVLLIAVITRQEKVNTLFSSLLTVLEYNSHYLFRFYRQQARKAFPALSLISAIAATLSLAVGIAFNLTASVKDTALSLYITAAALYLLAFLLLPYVRTVISYAFCLLLGKDKHIVLSKRGILSSRRLLDFRNNSMTFFKAEYRRVGSFYCISFYYHRRRGYSLAPSVYDVPLPLEMDEETVNELLSIYNSSELLCIPPPII